MNARDQIHRIDDELLQAVSKCAERRDGMYIDWNRKPKAVRYTAHYIRPKGIIRLHAYFVKMTMRHGFWEFPERVFTQETWESLTNKLPVRSE